MSRTVSAELAPAVHPKSPGGARRQQDVPCQACGLGTWNVCARCNPHCTCGPERGRG